MPSDMCAIEEDVGPCPTPWDSHAILATVRCREQRSGNIESRPKRNSSFKSLSLCMSGYISGGQCASRILIQVAFHIPTRTLCISAFGHHRIFSCLRRLVCHHHLVFRHVSSHRLAFSAADLPLPVFSVANPRHHYTSSSVVGPHHTFSLVVEIGHGQIHPSIVVDEQEAVSDHHFCFRSNDEEAGHGRLQSRTSQSRRMCRRKSQRRSWYRCRMNPLDSPAGLLVAP